MARIKICGLMRMEDVEAVIEQQIRMNSAIAQEGAERDWGCSVGRQMLRYGKYGTQT